MKLRSLFFAVIALITVNNVVGMDQQISSNFLDNSLCTAKNSDGSRQRVFRARAEGEPISGIMLHYTVCQTYQSTLSAYYGAGVSAHFTIEYNGTSHYNVPTSNIAFHAGPSQFRELAGLNKYYIGIEHVHPGYVESGVTYDSKWGTPVKLHGDERLWFSFSEEQFVASCTLIAQLQDQFKIKRSLVLTHADAAIGRKSDIGPMWDYRLAFTKFMVGFFPTNPWIIDLLGFENFANGSYISMIRFYGYRALDPDNTAGEIKAFQMHFSQQDISGTLSEPTKIAILNFTVNYYFFKDPIYGYDEDFRRDVDKFITEHSLETSRLLEVITKAHQDISGSL